MGKQRRVIEILCYIIHQRHNTEPAKFHQFGASSKQVLHTGHRCSRYQGPPSTPEPHAERVTSVELHVQRLLCCRHCCKNVVRLPPSRSRAVNPERPPSNSLSLSITLSLADKKWPPMNLGRLRAPPSSQMRLGKNESVPPRRVCTEM